MKNNMKHITGIQKYFYLLRALHPEIFRLPMPFLWFLLRQMRYEKLIQNHKKTYINTTYTPFPSQAYVTALRNFYRISKGGVAPFSAYISLTNQCPFNCWHCSNEYASDLEDMTTAQLTDIILQLQTAGIACIGFTGGEPTTREDLEDLIAQVDERSCSILFSTGYYIDKQRARSLAQAGLSTVVISLDSHIKEDHNQKRQWAIAFDEALVAIQACLDAEIYTAVSMVITRDMLQQDRIHDFVYFVGKLGVPEIRIFAPKPCGKLRADDPELLTEEELQQVQRIQYDVNRNPDLPSIMAYSHITSERNYGCNGGRTHVYINAQGEVCPCDFTPLSFGNVKTEPFEVIYDRMTASFPKASGQCILTAIAPYLDSIGLKALPVKDPETIKELLSKIPRKQVPLLFQKLRMKDRASENIS